MWNRVSGSFMIFQKYLNSSISNQHARSTPQNKRTNAEGLNRDSILGSSKSQFVFVLVLLQNRSVQQDLKA